MRRAGFSLLEVILAMAILAGAIAVLGEAGRLALRNAGYARDMAQAQLLCETIMAELATGVMTPDSVSNSTFDSTGDSMQPDEPGWLFSIDNEQTDEDGLISVRVTVTRDQPEAQHPIQFSLVQWMPDPNYQSPTSSSSSTSGSSSAGGGG
jgi:type II secretion system protein I